MPPQIPTVRTGHASTGAMLWNFNFGYESYAPLVVANGVLTWACGTSPAATYTPAAQAQDDSVTEEQLPTRKKIIGFYAPLRYYTRTGAGLPATGDLMPQLSIRKSFAPFLPLLIIKLASLSLSAQTITVSRLQVRRLPESWSTARASPLPHTSMSLSTRLFNRRR
jgi:hypothetical protein